MNEKNALVNKPEIGKPSGTDATKGSTRRKFLGQIGAALTGGAVLGKAALASARSDNSGLGEEIIAPGHGHDSRVQQSLQIRLRAAQDEAHIHAAPQTTNGDEQRYHDKSGTYSKGILQDGIGLVNLNAFQSFKRALNSGDPADFEQIIMGGTRTLNGPQGGLALALEGRDAIQFGKAPCRPKQEHVVVVPPAPPLASAAYGTELV